MKIFNLFKRDDSSVEETEKENQNDEIVDSISPDDALLKSLLKREKIDKSKAMSIPAVSSAVDLISNMVAMLPIKLYKKEKTEDKLIVKEIVDDIRINLLNQDSKDTLDPFQLKKAIATDYLIEKGAYVYIERERGEFKSLRYVDPFSIEVIKNQDPIFKDIQYLVNGKAYETYSFITVLRNTKSGGSGNSIIKEISNCLETSFETIMYELGIVKKGGGKKGFLTAEKKLGKPELAALKKAWQQYYGNNEENIIILNKGVEFKEGSNSSVELQINERKKTLKDDINSVFHVSDNYEDTVKNAVMPILSAIESALNKTLLLEKEKGVLYFAFDTKNIIRGSLKERYEAYKLALDSGWLGINEIRADEDKEPIEGLDIIKLNLANVLYDTKNKKFYVPNTGEKLGEKMELEGGKENSDES